MLAAIDRGACTIGVASTGVAGPDGQDGHAPGEFHVGLVVATRDGLVAEHASHVVPGDREHVRAALELLDAALDRTDLDVHSGSTP